MSDPSGSTIKVAQLMGTDLRPYRAAFVRAVADTSGIELTLFVCHTSNGLDTRAQAHDLDTGSARIHLVRCRQWPGSRPRVAWQSGAAAALRGDYDVIVCQEVVHNLSFWLVRLLHRLLNKRFIIFGHGHRRNSKRQNVVHRAQEYARRVLLRSADAIAVYTDGGRSGTLAAGVPNSKIFVVQNTLDVTYLQSVGARVSDGEISELRRSLGIDSEFVLLYVGRLLPPKRVDLLILAQRHLSARGVRSKVVIVGDGESRPELERLAIGMSSVRFVGESYEERLLAPYFLGADLLVLPGRVGLGCVHGFAYGLPTVTTSEDDVAQSPEYEYIGHEINGWIVERADPGVLADGISSILGNPAFLSGLSTAALQTASSMTIENMAEHFVSAVRYATSEH